MRTHAQLFWVVGAWFLLSFSALIYLHHRIEKLENRLEIIKTLLQFHNMYPEYLEE